MREKALLVSLGLLSPYLGLATQIYNYFQQVGQVGLTYRTNISPLSGPFAPLYKRSTANHKAYILASYQDQY